MAPMALQGGLHSQALVFPRILIGTPRDMGHEGAGSASPMCSKPHLIVSSIFKKSLFSFPGVILSSVCQLLGHRQGRLLRHAAARSGPGVGRDKVSCAFRSQQREHGSPVSPLCLMDQQKGGFRKHGSLSPTKHTNPR